jgi:hypothetical protein
MFELAERRVQQPMPKTDWTPDIKDNRRAAHKGITQWFAVKPFKNVMEHLSKLWPACVI